MPESISINKYLILSLATLLLACLLVLSLFNQFTRSSILDNQQLATRNVMDDIIPRPYMNDIFADSLAVTEPGYLGNRQPVRIYRARTLDDTTGVVFYPVIATGYNSRIELAIGIAQNGTITGVRIISENETEGLGDQAHQDRSDWILSFTGTSFTDVPREDWKVSSENGYFDQISGATITSRSIINAVKSTLDYHAVAHDKLYE